VSAGPAAVTRTLTLAAYTTPREAYGEAILPAFAAHWKERTGETITFDASYQGSGAQARAVVGGLEADVVALSLDPDVQTIADAGLIQHDWHAAAVGGMVTRSLVVFGVRSGNPKGITDWSDLTRADVEVLTPDVRTSGGAIWNVAALWGAGLRGGLDEAGATTQLSKVLGRVRVMDKGARESITTFEKGVGDVAITYENEVFVARKEGRAMDYVVPPRTLRIDNPVAVVDTYAQKHGNADLAAAFVAFLVTPEAQEAFAAYGLRPVVGEAPAAWPRSEGVFTVEDLGGWASLKSKLLGEAGVYGAALEASRR
jgi:sulfate transport system substrate-binding protein